MLTESASRARRKSTTGLQHLKYTPYIGVDCVGSTRVRQADPRHAPCAPNTTIWFAIPTLSILRGYETVRGWNVVPMGTIELRGAPSNLLSSLKLLRMSLASERILVCLPLAKMELEQGLDPFRLVKGHRAEC